MLVFNCAYEVKNLCSATLIVILWHAAGNILSFPFVVQGHQLQLTRDEEGSIYSNTCIYTQAHTHTQALVPSVTHTHIHTS